MAWENAALGRPPAWGSCAAGGAVHLLCTAAGAGALGGALLCASDPMSHHSSPFCDAQRCQFLL